MGGSDIGGPWTRALLDLRTCVEALGPGPSGHTYLGTQCVVKGPRRQVAGHIREDI